MERYNEIVSRLLKLCMENSELKAVIAIGSQCRHQVKADRFSDLDLIIGCEDHEKILLCDKWVGTLGEIKYSFVEDTIADQKERRVLFSGDLDVDMIVFPWEQLVNALKNHQLDGLLQRSSRLLYGDEVYARLLKQIPSSEHLSGKVMPEKEFVNLVHDFFFHTVWAKKKIMRGEIWVGQMSVNGYLKNLLLKMIEQYEISVHNGNYDVWHDGRMLEKWADSEILRELESCFCGYSSEELLKALESTKKLFIRLAGHCAREYGYTTGIPEIDCNDTVIAGHRAV